MMLASRRFCRSSWLTPIRSSLSSRFFSDVDGPKQRVAKVKKKDRSKQQEGGRKDLDLILACLDAPVRKEGPISDEEKARRHKIGRDYVIGRFEQNNTFDHELSSKINMKLHAVNMLPKNSRIREEALKIDHEGPPLWRNQPTWTPPIPGFDPSQFVDKEEK